MAWNPSKEVAVARDAAKALDAKQAIVLYVMDNGQYGMASYGQTKDLCKQAGRWGDRLFDELKAILIEEQA